MLRKIAILLFLTLSGHQSIASPQEDAQFIVDGIWTEEFREMLRANYTRAIVSDYAKPITELNLTIIDPDKFADLLPDSLTDPQLALAREKIVALHIRLFNAEQLAGIAEFQRTTVWEKLVNASSDPSIQDEFIVWPYLSLDAARLSQYLTPAEVQSYETFFEEDAGKAFDDKSTSMGIGVLLAGIVDWFDKPRTAAEMNTTYMIKILETDGVIGSPNRIWRRDVIAQIRSEIE